MTRIVRLIVLALVIAQVMYSPVAMAVEEASAPVDEPVAPLSPDPSLLPQKTVEDVEEVAPSQSAEKSSSPSLPTVSQPTVVQEETTEEPAVVLPPLVINRVVAGITGSTAYEYVELYNPNPNDVEIDNWHVAILRKEGDSKQEITLHGTVKAKSYVLIAGTDSALDSFTPDLRMNSNVIVTTGGIIQLVDTTNTVKEQVEWGDTATPSLSLPTGSALERNYTDNVPSLTNDNTKDFMTNTTPTAPRGGGYAAYVAPVNRCEGIIISEIAANTADKDQFIELHNTSNNSVALDQCLLQTNRSTTKSFALTGTINSGEHRAISITTAGLDLTKTTSGTVYLLSSDGKEEVNTRSYDGLALNSSWAWFGGDDWRQTFAPSPNGANIWHEFVPCEAGYERNEETGRCRKIVTSDAALADCEPGKYRSSETNRCRNVEAAASLAACKKGQIRNLETNRCRNVESAATLAPCKAGQTRNPDTNRCRSVASLASTLTPCKEGQERNPATNRCRNVAKAIPAAGFAAEQTKDSPTAFVGWWALGGVLTLAAGYGIWEWRREIAGGFQKFGSVFSFRK